MGYSITVFLIPVSENEIPARLDDWHSANNILNDYAAANENRCWQVTSRDWWLEWRLLRLCEFLKITGLEFMGDEIACLGVNELEKAQIAAIKLLEMISDDMPTFPSNFHPDEHHLDYRDISKQEFKKALQESTPLVDIQASDDFESYGGLVDFFSFLKSLVAAISFSLERKKFLLMVRPLPY